MTLYEKIGAICVSMVAFQIVRTVGRVLVIIFSEQLNKQPDLTIQGRWAAVSGGSTGIGRAYAEALASRGLNIIIIDFDEPILKNVATEIRLKYNVQTEVLAADFSQTCGVYEYLENQLDKYDVGILINAIGLSYIYPELFVEITQADLYHKKFYGCMIYTQIINTNIYPTIHLCRIILKNMYKRKRGIIVNVSSTTAEISSPMLSIYAATKAYITKFTTDLHKEYLKHGIIIQCLQPGFVTKEKNPSLAWIRPNAQQYVDSAICTIGVRDITCGFVPHSILLTIFNIMNILHPRQTTALTIKLLDKLRKKIIVKKYRNYVTYK